MNSGEEFCDCTCFLPLDGEDDGTEGACIECNNCLGYGRPPIPWSELE